MKECSKELITYLSNEKNFLCCDLFEFKLRNGAEYYIADFDVDVVYGKKTYRHDLFLALREQTKIIGEPTVDSLNVTIYTDDNHEDKIEGMNILKAAHDGVLDESMVTLRRAYFDPDNKSLVGVIDLFSGKTEINNVGGLSCKIEVKSITSGLAQLYPVRIFASGLAYKEGGNGTIISSSTDKTTCAIPLKPSNNILIMV